MPITGWPPFTKRLGATFLSVSRATGFPFAEKLLTAGSTTVSVELIGPSASVLRSTA
jgi:hypothetical protein